MQAAKGLCLKGLVMDGWITPGMRTKMLRYAVIRPLMTVTLSCDLQNDGRLLTPILVHLI